ncbi:MAG: DUF4845 domain-containing protein [Candidatus Accumulibacter sp.]|jgi:hypothetical protein|nr:DUF4845 domain-containing protein [Accumulibacter sp.]
MIKKQRGISLSSLVVVGAILCILAILTVKILPDVVEFYKIKKSIAATAANASGKMVGEIRVIYSRYAEVDHIRSISPEEIVISRDGGDIILSFAYEKRIPLFANVSLLIDFHGVTSARDRSE